VKAIALKESRETIYWLRLLKEAGMYGDWEALIQEADGIARIIGAIIVNTKNNRHQRQIYFLPFTFYLLLFAFYDRRL
jgi:hypothetical protein